MESGKPSWRAAPRHAAGIDGRHQHRHRLDTNSQGRLVAHDDSGIAAFVAQIARDP
ncbi:MULTISPECIES: hypothetical protein [unclassified Burkholderia]|uniref:hypothetical protein n=1 Tax=unclassified Burkholderia TaxID=2613784 RepID=UPI001980307E|nr:MULTISPECIES: hypothetical protein [unclassified Burkholderia]MBN3771460.1 hypothetical protein [Burkholderia sp. Se-20378]MBN3796973.1 hypothetical protein [Burkholderia sp. Ac-20392]